MAQAESQEGTSSAAFESLGQYVSHVEYGFDDWGAPVLGFPSETPEGQQTAELIHGLRELYGRENVSAESLSDDVVEVFVKRPAVNEFLRAES